MRTAAYFVASAARMASHSARRLASVLAACRSRGWQPRPVLGWSPGGRQGCQRMIEGQLADSTGGRRPAIWFSTCCCAPAEPALQKVRFWDPEHWRFRALPTTTTVLLRLPRSNWPLRKKERLAIDASPDGGNAVLKEIRAHNDRTAAIVAGATLEYAL